MNLPSDTSQNQGVPAKTLSDNPLKGGKLANLSLTKKIAFFGGGFLLIFIVLITIISLYNSNRKPTSEIPETNPSLEIDKAKEEAERKEQEELSSSTPINKLQSAYTDVIGSNSLKRKLEIDASGIATIEYTIPSSDGQTIIKTSYENFADLAVKVFNIESIKRLSVTTFATKFTDEFGQPNQSALKMQVTKETSDKVNWPLKKFAYTDYVTILDFHELNPLLQKDYDTLTKKKN